jgi:hypothetical protein
MTTKMADSIIRAAAIKVKQFFPKGKMAMK